jgi:hypothetical protein
VTLRVVSVGSPLSQPCPCVSVVTAAVTLTIVPVGSPLSQECPCAPVVTAVVTLTVVSVGSPLSQPCPCVSVVTAAVTLTVVPVGSPLSQPCPCAPVSLSHFTCQPLHSHRHLFSSLRMLQNRGRCRVRIPEGHSPAAVSHIPAGSVSTLHGTHLIYLRRKSAVKSV